ncbi:unnamed protein product [Aspergillus oryzae RIB40]|uniref:DNA, SC003 n=2 Tax=Aspergillus oryzae TaxID=5062 RepID=Q2UJ27_ASPOR|nr:unnamed protein product [Aspergillus oryzae RIB40]EIT83622.1 hypothetical protein Ao3042_05048 [Aspergillus oryzae 3.042]KDE85588.1 hypothetical protein AO1008_01170 [Aspergillus oryzae 100-8]BAE58438.1 unnamed protein product [Aspergillus oryzae RIB40]|eukprot:EIT83622.1 hypothetical protein Ao3042_05048 [Aspergillus oryzae 3.042]
MSRPSFDLHNSSVQALLPDHSAVNTPIHTTYSTDSSASATLDALSAKQKSIHLLKTALENLPSTDINLIVTVILLFINLELIDSGKNAWRAHVKGAMKLISSLKPFQNDQLSPIALIRDRITSDCLTYNNHPETLRSKQLSLLPNNSPPDPLPGMRAIKYSLYSSCHRNPQSNQRSILLTKCRASIRCRSLGQQRRRRPDAPDPKPYPYSPRSPKRNMDSETLVTEIIHHLSFIDPKDPLSKATSWPTFIAGAETDNPVYRQWALDRLSLLWNVLPWGYVQTAVEVMRMAWRLRDEANSDIMGLRS